ncbi:exodeoxyribonuclease 7 small subunit [Actinomycetospora sp. NBRC 106375]|uniref:exodeoxyribonuclease VII small subunit n=1 Tax=Actinomycetospora sp. NBRC 106375 TaxID=3032207 RepID=UPI00249FBE6C|nr:exodeoxyribonuclease VII small subunit [Actinomycetospora sp. NBRC 106375]GLZ46790.1 exodeoxyribonuclease 7 small subunit [Actinomycetospora sp. NBRC 106375]
MAQDPGGEPGSGSGSDPGYEEARDELEAVVAKLEAGGLSLEDSLALWERGEALARVCERHLAGARERVETVLHEAGDADDGQ